MNREIFKQSKFYIAVISFFLTVFFIFREGAVAKLGALLWFLTFVVSLYKANRIVSEK